MKTFTISHWDHANEVFTILAETQCRATADAIFAHECTLRRPIEGDSVELRYEGKSVRKVAAVGMWWFDTYKEV